MFCFKNIRKLFFHNKIGVIFLKEVLNFINSNAMVASFITLIITTIIQIIFRKSDRGYSEKQYNRREKRKQFENKAESIIDNNIIDDGLIPHINLFMTDFKVKIINNKKDVEFIIQMMLMLKRNIST